MQDIVSRTLLDNAKLSVYSRECDTEQCTIIWFDLCKVHLTLRACFQGIIEG